MILLVTGGRELSSKLVADWLLLRMWREISQQLGLFPGPNPITLIIHGDAAGADQGADLYGRWLKIPVRAFPADWDRYPLRAGPVRNAQMLSEGRPDIAVAFPGHKGTADMVRQLTRAEIPIVQAIGDFKVLPFHTVNRLHK